MRRGVLLLNWAMIPTSIGLILLLGLTLVGWPRVAPDPTGGRPAEDASVLHPASDQVRLFFGWGSTASWQPLTNSANPFYTLAIRPAPPPKPPPPAPATRKVDVIYRGFFETSARVRRAVVQVADKQLLTGKGDTIVADYVVTEIELGHLGATNGAGAAVTIGFSKTVSIEVPAK